VEEIVPKIVSLGTLQKVLQRLLRERVSIRDFLTILETVADYAPLTKNVDVLTGYVRQTLARLITRDYRDADGNITVVLLSPDIEERISKSVQHAEYESFVVADPTLIQKIVDNFHQFVEVFTERGVPPIILCSPTVRMYVRNILEKFFPTIVVLSHNEMTRDVTIKSLGMLVLNDAN